MNSPGQARHCFAMALGNSLGLFLRVKVEMAYPPAKQRPQRGPPASPGSPSKKEPRTTFGSVLAQSLAPQAEVRAWFDEQLGYQPLSQSKLPLGLPQVPSSSRSALHAAFFLSIMSDCQAGCACLPASVAKHSAHLVQHSQNGRVCYACVAVSLPRRAWVPGLAAEHAATQSALVWAHTPPLLCPPCLSQKPEMLQHSSCQGLVVLQRKQANGSE